MTTVGTTQAVIFHGYGATPADHWFGWLAEQLEHAGVPTRIPALPDSAAPSPDTWAATAAEQLGNPGTGTIVVAHSLGCLTVLRHLASLKGAWKVGTLVLVSGFVDPLPGLPELDDFIGDAVDLSGVRERTGSLTVLRSDDDDHVPVELTDRLAGLLGTSAQVVPGAGHFLATDGVTTLRHAFDAIV
ncbi:putative alpha/beta hydrolase family esterase [Dietzia sp. 2505]|uniref:RBBP9/YdeN family alpha/beta hydrolase n=1 Tax=Dietzia sp. 2505 TaxID=3156457 RepID=UPI003390D0A0